MTITMMAKKIYNDLVNAPLLRAIRLYGMFAQLCLPTIKIAGNPNINKMNRRI